MNGNKFKTTDIVLAAFLRLRGFDLKDIELNGNKGIFNFINVPDRLLEDYDLGRCVVEPVAFNNTVKQLTTSVRRKANNN